MKTFKDFKAVSVPLIGTNLIEASAGTGKTYSIAILVLRLLLEKKIPIKEILMVTFTKAAVAELEERIRKFVRLANKASKNEEIEDSTIAQLVKKAIDNSSEKEVQRILNNAILFLDETSVLTIHSFCQQTLNQFSFETQQLFGVDLMQDMNTIMADEINQFWRKNITNIPTLLLNQLVNSSFGRNSISSVVSDHLSGKKYINYQENKTDYSISDASYQQYIAELAAIDLRLEKIYENTIQYLVQNRAEILQECEKNRYAKVLIPFIDEPEELLENITAKKSSAYIQKLFPEIVAQIDDFEAVANEKKLILTNISSNLYCHAINEISKGVQYYKIRYNQITYDDLITNLHKALVDRENPNLIACLQEKYKAVFIDEFQDTDKMQYEIFQKAFADNTILFYIGDPKQSIYAWRKADIFTYFKAKEAVDHLYGMNHNYRSSDGFINAMNLFFKPTEDFDTFYFNNPEQSIDYVHVEAPENNKKGNLTYNGAIEVPISIFECAKKDDLFNGLAAQIIDLLSNKSYKIETKAGKRAIQPQDIGILIRNKKDGILIKSILSKFGIPAITIDDGKVLQSAEANGILYLLEAISSISRASINKALLSPFTGFKEADILKLNDELIVELFRKYKASWDKNGIYHALNEWIKDFDIKRRLLNNHTEYGERLITNLYQIIELLHKVQSSKNLSSIELMSWLKRGIEGMKTTGDEYEQRIENDDEAIKIVTIHKSKGLEYNIVFAPTLDLLKENNFENCSFRDPITGDYISAEKNQLTPEQTQEYQNQNEQENRRLIYVAITRGVYKSYIYRNTAGYYKDSSLVPFITALKPLNSTYIAFQEPLILDTSFRYNVKSSEKKSIEIPAVNFILSQQNWRRMSYSMLRADHQTPIKLKTHQPEDEYDNFIFAQLKKGAKTGNMLHYIFENIYFHDASKWGNVIDKAIALFIPQQKESYAPMLMAFLNHVLSAKIQIEDELFSLNEVNSHKCIHEFEFDFNVTPFQPQGLRALADENTFIDVKNFPELEGIMNGKIDLFFEHQGKYYVLDWKSNYLGDLLSDYKPEKLNEAMNESNYHLQYLLYSLAAKKYLESRIPNFNYKYHFGGVIYLFLRGIRADGNTGIFARKPEWKTLANLSWRLEGDKT